MFENKLMPFVIKQIAVYLFMLSIVILFFNNRWALYLGLFAGSALSIIRLLSNAWIIQKAVKAVKNHCWQIIATAALFIVNQLLLLAVLYVFYKLNLWFFISLIAGVLLAPFTIIVNSITEALGITKNRFYID